MIIFLLFNEPMNILILAIQGTIKVVAKWLVGGRPILLLIFFEMLYLFLPTELSGDLSLLVTRRHRCSCCVKEAISFSAR